MGISTVNSLSVGLSVVYIGNAFKGQTEGSLHVAMRHIMAHSPVFRAVLGPPPTYHKVLIYALVVAELGVYNVGFSFICPGGQMNGPFLIRQ